MSGYKIEQHHVTYRGRHFHFVSYDGVPANTRRAEPAVPPMWYLMGPGKRWQVMPQVTGLSEDEVAQALLNWLKDQGLVPSSSPAA
jgi:hypothetical protein